MSGLHCNQPTYCRQFSAAWLGTWLGLARHMLAYPCSTIQVRAYLPWMRRNCSFRYYCTHTAVPDLFVGREWLPRYRTLPLRASQAS
ncbi:hypothetical protein F5Y07DRAFT_282058 [Xylaria sp. FL0933]|nr:hypothetical protein F5Y07DRAFT_282058 [Xylaria sp. FL0933]